MYKEFAEVYDLIYSFIDYKKSCKKLAKLIKKYKKSPGNKLLDVACGTGSHLFHLQDKFICTGVDINADMLEIAKEKVRNCDFIQTDMISMNLNKKFDVLTCLFSSIGYVKTYENLKQTIHNFSNHLNIGGIVIIEPWLTKSVYRVGFPSMTTYDREDIKIARLNTTNLKDDLSTMEMHYLMVKKGEEVKYFKDYHELGLFDTDKTIEIMENANFEVKSFEKGLMVDRGIFIGIKQ
ncbi:MAG: class I SAM-dependent methyltransferase [Promethearchaeota archaeon]|nr:MAG: class I SAM-dependent methyltransferase [Candidatus Lokiarchaeota archaeon]